MEKLLLGSSLDLLRTIPTESIDAIITDPPYGINYKEWDEKKKWLELTENWIGESFRVLKPQGQLWSFMAFSNIIEFIPLVKSFNFLWQDKNSVVWGRGKGRGSSQHLKSLREEILHFTKNKTYTWNNLKVLREVIAPYMKDGKPRGWFLNHIPDSDGIHKRVRWTGLGNVWCYSAPQWNGKEDKRVHPCQKPLILMERLILLSSNEGDVILDPFCGSGSTLVACKKLNRQFIGIEKDEKYHSIASGRLL